MNIYIILVLNKRILLLIQGRLWIIVLIEYRQIEGSMRRTKDKRKQEREAKRLYPFYLNRMRKQNSLIKYETRRWKKEKRRRVKKITCFKETRDWEEIERNSRD